MSNLTKFGSSGLPHPDSKILIGALGTSVIFLILFIIILIITQPSPQPQPSVLTLTSNPTSTPTSTDTPIPIYTPTLTDTPTPTRTSTLTDTPTPTRTSTPTGTPTPTDTPIPTYTPTLTDTPTPTRTSTPTDILVFTENLTIETGMATERLNVRRGPSISYETVTGLQRGDKVVLLGRNTLESWLKVMTPNGQEGWVVASYIETSVVIGDLQILLGPPKPSTPTPLDTNSPLVFLGDINVGGPSILGTIAPDQEHWYTFIVEGKNGDRDTPIVIIFRPNISFIFYIYESSKIPVWPPSDPNALENVCAGSRPGVDRDDDSVTGELICRGPLTLHGSYHLRVINGSSEDVEYCLATRDVFRWSCR